MKNINRIINSYFKEDNKIRLYILYFKILKRELTFLFFKRIQKLNSELRKKQYNISWNNKIRYYQNWFSPSNSLTIVEYKKKLFLSPGAVCQRIWQYYIYRNINQTSAVKILEVGSGNGLNSILLSCLFPKKNFFGIDISSVGIRYSKRILKNKVENKFFYGFPVIPKKKIGKVDFINSNAKNMKFKNNSFDFVFSVLALEQMDDIKKKVINEMVRVSSKYICFVEPFSDVNKTFLRKVHINTNKYFSYKINDLEKNHKLKIINIDFDHPKKITLGAACVLCKKY